MSSTSRSKVPLIVAAVVGVLLIFGARQLFSGGGDPGGSGTVAYKFLRSDGASGQVKTLTFDGPGTQAIEETWTLGAAGRTYSNWEAVQILDPDEVTSDKATFRITCTG